eukprot:6186481-Pleurochrysis_carterae.AAC.1
MARARARAAHANGAHVRAPVRASVRVRVYVSGHECTQGEDGLLLSTFSPCATKTGKIASAIKTLRYWARLRLISSSKRECRRHPHALQKSEQTPLLVHDFTKCPHGLLYPMRELHFFAQRICELSQSATEPWSARPFAAIDVGQRARAVPRQALRACLAGMPRAHSRISNAHLSHISRVSRVYLACVSCMHHA